MYRISIVLRDFDNNVLSPTPGGGTCTTVHGLEAARRLCSSVRRGYNEHGEPTTVTSLTVRIDGAVKNLRAGAVL